MLYFGSFHVVERTLKSSILFFLFSQPSDECKAFEGIIRNCLDAVVLRSLHPRTAIRVVVQEMSDDGSRLCAAVNAVFVALLDGGVQLSSTVVAAACAVMNDGRVFVDPTREEEAQAKAVVEFVLELKSQHVADANAKSDEATNTTAKTKDDGSGIGIVASRCRGVLTPAQYAECVSLAEGMAKTVEAFIRKLTEARFK